MAKRVIRLNENELNNLISESVIRILNEKVKGYDEGHMGDDSDYDPAEHPRKRQTLKQGFNSVIDKTQHGLDSASQINPSGSKWYSALSRLLGLFKGNSDIYRDDMDSYVRRRGYKGNRSFTKQDEEEFDKFLKARGYSK